MGPKGLSQWYREHLGIAPTPASYRAAGIAIEIDPQQYPNGRFARLHDPEGNPIEPWEPSGRDAHSG